MSWNRLLSTAVFNIDDPMVYKIIEQSDSSTLLVQAFLKLFINIKIKIYLLSFHAPNYQVIKGVKEIG